MSISEFFNNLFADWTTVVRGGVLLAAIIGVAITAIITNFKLGKIVVAGIAAAFAIWLVTGDGLGWFSQGIKNETVALAPVSNVLVVNDFTVADSTVDLPILSLTRA